MSKVWFIADTHFNHGNIIKFTNRPFLVGNDKYVWETNGFKWENDFSQKWRISYKSIEMMNNHLIDQINSVVGENDILWHLGDWALGGGSSYYRNCRCFRDRVLCQNVNIVWGNHDKPTKFQPSDDDYVIRDLFQKAFHHQTILVDKISIVVCHYAMAVWNKSHYGSWMLYGHSHGAAESMLSKFFPYRKSIDVGVDNAKLMLGEYRPFALEEIKIIFESRDESKKGE